MRTRLWSLSAGLGQRLPRRARVSPLDGGGDFVLDFTKGQLGGLVFTRASTSGIGQAGCTYIDTAGYFQLAGADVPRLNCALGGGSIRGLLVEEQRTNLCLRSALTGNAATSAANTPPTGWTHPHHNSPAWGSSTSTSQESQYGSADGASAIRQICNAARTYLNQTFTCTSGTTYTMSVYLEQITSGSLTYGTFLFANPAGGTYSSATYYRNGVQVASGDALQVGRIEVVIVCNGTGSIGFRVGIGVGGNDTGNVLFSRPQMEAAARASSYIPTTSAAITRPADFPSVLLVSSKATGSKGTAVIKYYRGEIASKTVAAGSLISGGADLLNIAHHVGGSADATVSDGVTTITQTNQAAGLNRAAASWTSDVVLDGPGYFSLNGAATLDGAIAVPSAATSLAIGRSLLTRHLNGEVAYVALYGDCRTGAALEALAA